MGDTLQSPAAAQIRRHFAAAGLREIEVPEWADEEGKPFVFCVRPFTLEEQRVLNKMVKGNDVDLVMYTFIIKALDRDGNRLFTSADQAWMKKEMDAVVLNRIVRDIAGVQIPQEELQANFEEMDVDTSSST